MNKNSLFFSLILYKKWERFLEILSEIDINYADQYHRTALHIASQNEDSRFLLALLDKGSNPNVQDENGSTPLYYAAEISLFKNVQILLERGADCNIQNKFGNTPLWAAVYGYSGKLDSVQLIFDNGANPNHKNKLNASPLDLSKTLRLDEVFTLLKTYAN